MPEISQHTELHPGIATDSEAEEPLPFRAFTRRRMVTALVVLLVLLLLIVVPPLFNVSRYKRQISSSIGVSIGRPVHIDNVRLTLLPLPGFTLERFVVAEDPAFGAEPVLRADEVHATLRVGSLWRRRLEFSRISLTDPSINLVHLPDGRWNLDSILLQASRIPAAPTAQRASGQTPRFPYIEATGARINLKLGQEKTPFSLTESDVALWLPEPGRWHLRLKAHPTRTDTAVSDTGVLRLDGTLGQAPTLAAVPLDLRADWTSAPLGALSLILLGRDAGLRGTMNLRTTVQGAVDDNHIGTVLNLDDLRRADFVPRHSIFAAIRCDAHAVELFHALESAHCTWPADRDGSGLIADLRVPDLRKPGSTTATIQLREVPVTALLDTLRVVSNRVSPELTATGLLSGSLQCCQQPSSAPATPGAPILTVPEATLSLPGQPPFLKAPLSASYRPALLPELAFYPVPLDLGGSKPATLAVLLDLAEITFQLTGEVDPIRLHALTQALPEFGDGLEPVLSISAQSSAAAPIQVNVLGEHRWFGSQTWSSIAQPSSAPQKTRHKHRRRPTTR